ncbi:hypothetical protein HAP94_08580 [Acidithiobacillus ferrivorans]|nr:hypothetical protein [Acidithiobacillus ferrivorans]
MKHIRWIHILVLMVMIAIWTDSAIAKTITHHTNIALPFWKASLTLLATTLILPAVLFLTMRGRFRRITRKNEYFFLLRTKLVYLYAWICVFMNELIYYLATIVVTKLWPAISDGMTILIGTWITACVGVVSGIICFMLIYESSKE